MKFCTKCGTQISDSQSSCPQCASAGKTCPGGKHTMDPTWTECVYCKQEKVAARQTPAQPVRFATVVENPILRGHERPAPYKGDNPLPPRPIRPINAPLVNPTQPSVGQSSRPRTHTEFRPIPHLASEGPSVSRDRKIVGVLVSYSWAPEGRIYPIREGRNFIGRDKDCEVCVPEDTTLSAQNSHITFRQNFVIGDMVSMTGTDVDGVPIEEQFRSLSNYATIRAGSTHFTFIAIKPQTPAQP